jgi:GDP-mannose 6-dehydrogenase
MNRIPHISKLMMATLEGVLDHAETIVIGNNGPEFREVHELVRPGQVVVDLVRVTPRSSEVGQYDGICW